MVFKWSFFSYSSLLLLMKRKCLLKINCVILLSFNLALNIYIYIYPGEGEEINNKEEKSFKYK